MSQAIGAAAADAFATASASSIFPGAKHFVSKEHVHFEFSSAHEPVVRADSGDLIHVETHDCFHGKIQPGALARWEDGHRRAGPADVGEVLVRATAENGDGKEKEIYGGTYVGASILDDIPREQMNPITGPIYVNGARPGDMLAVSLLDIRPRGIGVACCGSCSGQLSNRMARDTSSLRFFDLSECGSVVTMREPQMGRRRMGPIAFPASPMLGVVGVAPSPSEGDPIGTMPAGKHGGNLDNKANGIGSTIYIPIHHHGGLLSLGDMHASQGDGEIAGTGVEIGGDVLIRCDILRHEDLYGCTYDPGSDKNDSDWRLEYPVTETHTHWITHGVVECDVPETTSVACREAAKILVGQWGFTLEEAFIFLSVKGDLGLCQACHPDKGTQIAKMSVPKLEGLCPQAFRAPLARGA